MKPLSETQTLVIMAGTMYNTDKEALAYIKDNGHKMSRTTYWRTQTKLQESATARLYEEAKGAVGSQMKIIDELETLKKQLWILYNDKATIIIEKIRILREIRELIPHITAARAAIPHVISEVIKNFGKEDSTTKPRTSKESPIPTA